MFINAFFNIARKIAYDVGNLHFPYLDVPFNPATERHEGDSAEKYKRRYGWPPMRDSIPAYLVFKKCKERGWVTSDENC